MFDWRLEFAKAVGSRSARLSLRTRRGQDLVVRDQGSIGPIIPKGLILLKP
jgi:hypothetical protein